MERGILREAYFAELDPELRSELLEQYRETNPQDTDADLFQKLWTLRYTDPKDAGHRVDTFLWQIVNVMCLYRLSNFFSKGTEKEINAAMETLGFTDAAEYGKEGREVLYHEFRNAARRYFGTCDSKSYGKRLMGIVTMSENQRRDKMAREVWRLTEGLPERFETSNDMALFCGAVHDEFIAQCPDGEQRLKKQEEHRRKKHIA